MPQPFSLRPAQPPMVKFMREIMRCGLYAGMGIGKTSAVLFVLELLKLFGELDPRYPVLVIGPARVARSTWSDEAAKWAQFSDIRIVSLHGTPAERLKKLKMKADIFTISYELLPWLVDYWLAKWPYRTVVADELERLKGFREKKGGVGNGRDNSDKSGASGQRAYALGRVAHNLTDRWINLGGTPAPAGLKDLWGSTWFLDRGARLGRTFTDFKMRWFMPNWNGHGIKPLPFAASQIHAALADICLTVDPKDYYDLQEPIINPIIVKLPPKARAIYEKLEKDMFAVLDSGAEVEALTAAGLTNKCLQAANGALYTTHPAWEAIHDAKLEALDSCLSEAGGMPLLVQSSFISDKARILKRFSGAVDISTGRGLAAFKGGSARIGVCHPGSMGHGIDGLQYITNQLVRYGHVWKLSETQQMFERIGPMRQHQAGLDRAVFEHRIIAEDTIDLAVLANHVRNGETQDDLLDALNRYRKEKHGKRSNRLIAA